MIEHQSGVENASVWSDLRDYNIRYNFSILCSKTLKQSVHPHNRPRSLGSMFPKKILKFDILRVSLKTKDEGISPCGPLSHVLNVVHSMRYFQKVI
jgi:hypothetical protein